MKKKILNKSYEKIKGGYKYTVRYINKQAEEVLQSFRAKTKTKAKSKADKELKKQL